MSKILKSVSNGLRVATSKIIAALAEAARTISYVETVSNKADTLHRHIKKTNETVLKRMFEFNTRKAIRRMGLGKVVLAVDPTHELYYGEHGKLNVRQIQHEKGADEAFTYAVLSIVEPRPLPLMAIPYKQGDDLTAIIKELLEYAQTLHLTIECILFDRGFYIGELIQYLLGKRLKYLIFVPENSAMKRYITQTDKLAYFMHTIEWNKYFTKWKVQTKIVVIWDIIQRKGKVHEYYWCFATNLRYTLPLIRIYKQRWQIETDFRVHDEARIKSKSNESLIRYFYFLTSLMLMANWEVNRLIHPEICFKKYLKEIEMKFSGEVT